VKPVPDPRAFNQHQGQAGRTVSSRLERDGSFRVALLRQERKDLLNNFHGLVEIHASGQGSAKKVAEVSIDKLSTDPAQPYKLTIPGKAPEAPQGHRTGRQPPAASRTKANRKDVLPLELVATDGRTHTLADYQGQPVLLNLFTTWCGPCAEELPHLVDLHQRYAKQGLVVLAVSRGEDPAVVEAYARRKRLPFPILIDPTGAVTKPFAAEAGELAVPTNVLLDRNHQVAFADVGFTTTKLAKFKEAITRCLGP
jgi:peroxiredoxin